MQFVIDNWTVIFGGLGTAIVAAVVGAWAKSWFDQRAKNKSGRDQATQSATAGAKSQIIQAGRDVGTSQHGHDSEARSR